MNSATVTTPRTYAGLFLVAMCTLMYEILLTRIFSVTMWYHFAFVAISVAMFGMTAGAIIVYLFPRHFRMESAKPQLAWSAFAFSIAMVMSLLVQLSVPFVVNVSIVGLFSIALTYTVVSIPFVFSGICVCLALTRFPGRVSRLYAADLAGAALGCILLIYTIEVTNGPTAAVAIAAVASLASLLFAEGERSFRLKLAAGASAVVFLAFAVLQTLLLGRESFLLRVLWVKEQVETRPLYEKWNSFSRVRVSGDPDARQKPAGWGLSATYPADRTVRQLMLDIDAAAGTVLTHFDGDASEVEHLKYDVTNLVHYLRPDANVLVVGTGGGRDILSALVFGQRSAIGVEINKDVIDAVNGRFGKFTGHLDRYPQVSIVNDEARSYIARSRARYDIIQVSLIDTWAATAAAAFVLTENALYTVEAWELFLRHLTPQGVMTFSRWHVEGKPYEMHRLTALASASLNRIGVGNPDRHLVIVRHDRGEDPWGIGTVLVSREPFADADLEALEKVVQDMRFELVFSPTRGSLDPIFAALASGRDLDRIADASPMNISPPTDDSPFFFQSLRLRSFFDRSHRARGDANRGQGDFNATAVTVLGTLIVVALGLTSLCILLPLQLTTEKGSLRGMGPLLVYFAAIGLGFMFVEISQMQRLIVFLGSPTYSLSVVLFSLLLASGLGSFLTRNVTVPERTRSAIVRLVLLIVVLVAFGLLTPRIATALQGSETPVRIATAVGILFPIGLFMGMAFPIGMKLATSRGTALTPWLWGINGATSVCASVLSVAIALGAGISTSFVTGCACYAVALLSFLLASRRLQRRAEAAGLPRQAEAPEVVGMAS